MLQVLRALVILIQCLKKVMEYRHRFIVNGVFKGQCLLIFSSRMFDTKVYHKVTRQKDEMSPKIVDNTSKKYRGIGTEVDDLMPDDGLRQPMEVVVVFA